MHINKMIAFSQKYGVSKLCQDSANTQVYDNAKISPKTVSL